MNRVGLGLAVGAGYLLGRTKKLKLAVAVGTMVAGKKMNLTPKGIAELVSGQLQNNPQFKEIGDQLRGDLRGVGKAASGALVERQIDALASRLSGRTAQMREQLAGGGSRDSGVSEDPEEYAEDDERDEPDEGEEREERPQRAAKKTARKTAPAKKAAAKAPAKKTAAKRAQPAKKAVAKKTSGARGAARGTRSARSKDGGE
ncbi:DNA primase [Streptomyces sp. NPDC048182]|uniref:DNA primase n=1 Tax=unclassified Streptomyces TaxID=2593676 RepID=UPI00339FDA70